MPTRTSPIKGGMLLRAGSANVAAAEESFNHSIEMARRQGALAWELRSATDLAKLWRRQGRDQDARALLEPVHAKFTEGFWVVDVASSAALLEQLAPSNGRGS